MSLRRRAVLLGMMLTLTAGICLAQFRGGRGGGRGFGGWGGWGDDAGPLLRTEGGQIVDEDTVRTARETASHSTGTPEWTNTPGFENDVFTFARIIYKQSPNWPMRSMLRWINDYPDADLNLSFRLQQMTSMRVDPDGRVLRLTDPRGFFRDKSTARPDSRDLNSNDLALFDYPFIYVVKPAGMELKDEEVPILRKYLLNGGALMADDFWGDTEWGNFEAQIKRVFPGRNWQELPLSHPIFHCVFPIESPPDLSKVQVPSIHRWERRNPGSGMYGGFNARPGDGDPNMHVRAWLDDKGRIMVIATHNTDNGDGWEREGENHEYFETFSETRAYPLAINIIFYLMTH